MKSNSWSAIQSYELVLFIMISFLALLLICWANKEKSCRVTRPPLKKQNYIWMGKCHQTWIPVPGVNWWKTDGPRDLGYAQYHFPLLQFCQELLRNSPTISPFPLPRNARQTFKKRHKIRELPTNLYIWTLAAFTALLKRNFTWGRPLFFALEETLLGSACSILPYSSQCSLSSAQA